jgi:exodeoxyribonuclease-3
VAVVSECCTPERARAPGSAVWVGDNPNKGLGVFSFGDLRVELDAAYDPTIQYALPVRVGGDESFNVLAIWAHYGLSGMRVGSVGPTLRALQVYEPFLRERAAVVAGDLNNHLRWDRPGKAWNHANAVSRLAELGFVSAYHAFERVEQGAELHPTFYWRTRDTYHSTMCSCRGGV